MTVPCQLESNRLTIGDFSITMLILPVAPMGTATKEIIAAAKLTKSPTLEDFSSVA